MYFWIELQKFQSRLKTKNSGNIWKQISQNISCREMRFSPQSSNKLYLLQKDFLRKGFSYYHFRKKPSGGQLLKMIKSAAENVFFWKDLCLLVDFLLTRNRQSFVHQSEEGQGDTEIFMPDWSQTNSNLCETVEGLIIWQFIFKY